MVVVLVMGSKGTLVAYHMDRLCHIPASEASNEVAGKEDGGVINNRGRRRFVYVHRRKYVTVRVAFLYIVLFKNRARRPYCSLQLLLTAFSEIVWNNISSKITIILI